MDVQYVLADVFTDRPFAGNQLAVIPDARGLSSRAMQAITREFNFSESTFVLPATDPAHHCRVRIFTPSSEIGFAGHPTVGTAAVLAYLGRVELNEGAAHVVFDEAAGPLAVDIEVSGAAPFARFAVDRPLETAPGLAASALATVLSLPEEAVIETWFAGLGLPFCFVRLADREAVDRATINGEAWTAHMATAWSSFLYFFAGDTQPGERLYARMLAPGAGITEDPATGSAAAALAATLGTRSPQREGTLAWTIDQGVAMGRPSVIAATAEKTDGALAGVTVGGTTVIVGQGTLSVPDGY